MIQVSPGAEAIFRLTLAHSLATSTDNEAENGHNCFEPHFNDPAGPWIGCALCHVRLALP